MTMATGRQPDGLPPASAREQAILFAPMAEMDIAAIADPSQVQQNRGFPASRSEHRAAVTRLARSRKPRRSAKSP